MLSFDRAQAGCVICSFYLCVSSKQKIMPGLDSGQMILARILLRDHVSLTSHHTVRHMLAGVCTISDGKLCHSVVTTLSLGKVYLPDFT